MNDTGSGRGRRAAGRRGPRRVSLLGRIFRSLLTVVVLAAIGLAGGAAWLKYEVEKPGPLKEPTVVMIGRGLGTEAIARRLEDRGAVESANVFMAGATAHKFLGTSNLKAGEYEIPAGASVAQIIATLQSGKSITYKLTIPEGLTTTQILDRMNANDVLVDAAPADVPEGALLPDTYVFQRGTTRPELLAQMKKAHDEVVDTLWKAKADGLPFKTKEEAVILASIVEKETGIAEERPRVAAVFVNRLKKGMRLQSDPTIIYGIVGGKGKLDRPLTRSDIAEKTAYNTYQIDGLPPTPIANPGKESIAAVMNPAQTGDLYFVADGTGGHAFAKTLAEHQANVKKWRQVEADRANEGDATAGDGQAPAADQPATASDAQASTGAASAAAQPAQPAASAATEEQQAEAAPATTPSTETAPAQQGGGLPIPEEVPPAGAPKPPATAPAPEAAATPAPAPATTTDAVETTIVKVAGKLVPLPKPKPAAD
ncbi:MAG: endolytic transglycosylase MltG [Hyphomicrobiales bacterium]